MFTSTYLDHKVLEHNVGVFLQEYVQTSAL